MSGAQAPPPPAGEAASAGAGEAPDPSWDLYAMLSDDTAAASAAGEAKHKLGPKSSDKELHTAYRRKAKRLHPDKNPDPKAAVLFAQLQVVWSWFSIPANRASYDARLAATATRVAKDAALDSHLSTMKKNLLAREAEAALAAMQKRNAAREAALNPRGAQTPEEATRAQNEALIRSLQAQGMLDTQQPVSRARDASERSYKSQRTSATDSTVHGGAAHHQTDSTGGGDEKHRTLVLRWGKGGSESLSPPTADSLRALVARLVPSHSHSSPLLEHVIVLPDKRKAMLVFTRSADAIVAVPLIAAAHPAFEVRRMEEGASSNHGKRAAAAAFVPTQMSEQKSYAAPAPSVPASGSAAASFFAPSHASTAAPSPSPPPSSSSLFSPGASSAAEYETSALARMAALAKQNKLKKMQQAQAAAAAAATAAAATSTTAAVDAHAQPPSTHATPADYLL